MGKCLILALMAYLQLEGTLVNAQSGHAILARFDPALGPRGFDTAYATSSDAEQDGGSGPRFSSDHSCHHNNKRQRDINECDRHRIILGPMGPADSHAIDRNGSGSGRDLCRGDSD